MIPPLGRRSLRPSPTRDILPGLVTGIWARRGRTGHPAALCSGFFFLLEKAGLQTRRVPLDLMSKTRPDIAVVEGDTPFPLSDEKELLRLYYEGNRLPSPTGGFLMVLRVQPEADGSGSILLECNSSSLRYRLNVNKATRTERTKVRDTIEEGREPRCPRHVDQLLFRVKNDLVCSLCGVRYGRA